MARNTVIPITQVRVIDTLNLSPHGKQDWRAGALECIASHITREPDQIVDHYEVKYDGMVLTVDVDEDSIATPESREREDDYMTEPGD